MEKEEEYNCRKNRTLEHKAYIIRRKLESTKIYKKINSNMSTSLDESSPVLKYSHISSSIIILPDYLPSPKRTASGSLNCLQDQTQSSNLIANKLIACR
jgi:hypothetical protein